MARKAVTNDFKVFSERLSVLAENVRLKVFQQRFEQLRQEKDLSNTEFARFLGMSRQTVGFYLNGDRIPDALMLVKIAQKCDVSADWLLGLSDVRSQDITIQNISKKTGLSEAAVLGLGEMMQSQKKYAFSDFMECFEAMIERIKQNTRNS